MSIRTKLLTLATALLLMGQASATERLTLRIGDQKGNMRAQLEAADALRDLPYDIHWAEFPAAAPLAEALNAGAIDAGIIGDAPLLFVLASGAPVKAIAVDKSDPTVRRCWSGLMRRCTVQPNSRASALPPAAVRLVITWR